MPQPILPLMVISTAKVLKNDRHRTITLPEDFAFDAEEVTIEHHGNMLVIRPVQTKKLGWDAFFDDPAMVVSEDFDTGEDPAPQSRS